MLESEEDRLFESVLRHGGVAQHAFFFDVDGTLVDIAETPGEVRVEPGLTEAVARLHRMAAGAVAMISGRAVEDVDRIFEPLRLPVAGQHGIERRDAQGKMHRHAGCSVRHAELRHCVYAAAARWPKVMVEDKGASLAVHYRKAPELADEVHAALAECLERVGEGYCLQPGKMVAELKPGGRDKGSAIADFMVESPFAARVPVFLGDDVTDEHGFAMVNRLGGHTIKIGEGATVARWRLANARAARRWLKRLLDRAGPGRVS